MQDESRRALEAIIMVADHPADPVVLAQLVELSPAAVEEILLQVAESYEQENRGFRLVKVAGGWRYQSHEDCSAYVEQFVLTGQTARLSAAALETLAIVAYKQPTSRAQVAAIRGVNVDGVMRTLQQRGYIDETGRDVGPGQASLFGTTDLFLERLGLNSIDELPSLGDLIPGADVVELLEQSLIGLPEFDETAPIEADRQEQDTTPGPADSEND
jgi:segregation and condensation protein B